MIGPCSLTAPKHREAPLDCADRFVRGHYVLPRVARPRASRALVQETRTLAQSVKCALLNAFKSLCDDLSLLLFVPID